MTPAEAEAATAYATAREVFAEAYAAYDVVRTGYRARTVDDATFIAARKVYDAALATVDVAFVAVQDAGEPEAVEAPEPEQFSLFE